MVRCRGSRLKVWLSWVHSLLDTHTHDSNRCLLSCWSLDRAEVHTCLWCSVVINSGSLSEVTREFICPLSFCGYDYRHPAWGLWGNGHLPVPVPSRSGVWPSIAAIKAVCDVDSLWLVQVSKHHCATLWPDMGHNITESQGSLFVARCHYLSCWHSEHV